MFTKDKLYDLYHINLDDPFLAVQENNNIAIILSRDIYDIQKIEGSIAVSGMTIWLHTVRAALAPEIRYLAKELWLELSRGMPKGEEWFPTGFAPSPAKM